MGYQKINLSSGDFSFIGGENSKSKTYQYQEVLDDYSNAKNIRIITYNVSYDTNNPIFKKLFEVSDAADIKVIIGVPSFTFIDYKTGERNYKAEDVIKSLKSFDIAELNDRLSIAVCPYNHSKIISTENVCYIGSENYSDASRQNYEAGLLLYNKQDIENIMQNYFQLLWEDSFVYRDSNTIVLAEASSILSDTISYIEELSCYLYIEDGEKLELDDLYIDNSYIEEELKKIRKSLIYLDECLGDLKVDNVINDINSIKNEKILHDYNDDIIKLKELLENFDYGTSYLDMFNEAINSLEEDVGYYSDADIDDLIQTNHIESHGYYYPEFDEEITTEVMSEIVDDRQDFSKKIEEILELFIEDKLYTLKDFLRKYSKSNLKMVFEYLNKKNNISREGDRHFLG